MIFETLKKRGDFLRGHSNSLCSFKTSSLIIVCVEAKESSSVRFGLTVSKKVGKAVVRNLVKRRLRSILYSLLKSGFFDRAIGFDFILIARPLCRKSAFSVVEKQCIYSFSSCIEKIVLEKKRKRS